MAKQTEPALRPNGTKIQWTTTPPTKPGWYWWRDEDNGWDAQPVEFATDDNWPRIFLFGVAEYGHVSGEWGPEIVLQDETKGGK